MPSSVSACPRCASSDEGAEIGGPRPCPRRLVRLLGRARRPRQAQQALQLQVGLVGIELAVGRRARAEPRQHLQHRHEVAPAPLSPQQIGDAPARHQVLGIELEGQKVQLGRPGLVVDLFVELRRLDEELGALEVVGRVLDRLDQEARGAQGRSGPLVQRRQRGARRHVGGVDLDDAREVGLGLRRIVEPRHTELAGTQVERQRVGGRRHQLGALYQAIDRRVPGAGLVEQAGQRDQRGLVRHLRLLGEQVRFDRLFPIAELVLVDGADLAIDLGPHQRRGQLGATAQRLDQRREAAPGAIAALERAQGVIGLRLDGEQRLPALLGAQRAAALVFPQEREPAIERGAFVAIVGGVGLALQVREVLDLSPLGLVEQIERAQHRQIARRLGDERFVARDGAGAIVELARAQLGRLATQRRRVLGARARLLVEHADDVGPALELAGELLAHLRRQRRQRAQLGGDLVPGAGAIGEARQRVPVGLARIFAVGGEQRGERARGVVGLVLEHARQLHQDLATPARLRLDVDASQGQLEQSVEVAALAQRDGDGVEPLDGVLARRLRRVQGEPAGGVVVLGQLLLDGGERLLHGGDEGLGRQVDDAQLPRRVQLVALDGADARQERKVLGLSGRDAGEEALGQKLQLHVAGVEADEDEAARAPQLAERGAQLAVGERGLQRLVRPQERLRPRRAAEQLEHEGQLAVGAQGRAIAGGERRRRDLVAYQRPVEPVVAARGDDAAERQRAQAGDDLGQLATQRCAQRRGEAIAQPSRDEAGGGERTRLQHGTHLAHVVGRQRRDQARQDVAQRSRRAAEARSGTQHAAAGAQQLDQRRQLGDRGRLEGRLFDGLGDRGRQGAGADVGMGVLDRLHGGGDGGGSNVGAGVFERRRGLQCRGRLGRRCFEPAGRRLDGRLGNRSRVRDQLLERRLRHFRRRRLVGTGLVGDAVRRTGDAVRRTGDAVRRTGDAVRRIGDAVRRVGDAVRRVGARARRRQRRFPLRLVDVFVFHGLLDGLVGRRGFQLIQQLGRPHIRRQLAGWRPDTLDGIVVVHAASRLDRKSNRWAGLHAVFTRRRGAELHRRSKVSPAVHRWLRNRGAESPRHSAAESGRSAPARRRV